MSFIICVILAGVVIGLWRRGSIWNLVNLRLRFIWFLPIGYLLQSVAINDLHGISYEISLVCSYVLILWFAILNIKQGGMKWIAVGALFNFLCMLSNGLRMPAYLPTVKAWAPEMVHALQEGKVGKSIAMGSQTHLNFLGDIFAFKVYPPCLISIGDILFGIGLLFFLQHAMLLKRPEVVGNAKQSA